MASLDDLHDATLLGFDLDWVSGELHCNFKVSSDGQSTVRLIAHGLSLLKCPRQSPWGRSASVNSARIVTVGSGETLIIEMQSGDVIEAHILNLNLE